MGGIGPINRHLSPGFVVEEVPRKCSGYYKLYNWSERSACDQQKVGIFHLLPLPPAFTEIAGGVVIGFQKFAWAPNSPSGILNNCGNKITRYDKRKNA